MTSWFDALSLRPRTVVLLTVTLLPLGVLVFSLLADEVRQAREAAWDRVRLLARLTAADLQRELDRSRSNLSVIAEQPLVKSLDPGRCGPIFSEFVRIRPERLTLDLRDLNGALVCSSLPLPATGMTATESRWFLPAVQRGEFGVSGAMREPRTSKWVTALSYPVRDDRGQQIGLLVLAIDLKMLNDQVLAQTPRDAVVTVADASRAVVLRSIQPEVYIGTRPRADTSDPAGGRREGTLDSVSRDGVRRLFAFSTLAPADWRVSAGMPRDAVFAEFNALVARSIALGVCTLLLGALLVWRTSVDIVLPLESLKRTVARVVEGDAAARAHVRGPPELRTVAAQFNQMLDGEAQTEAKLKGIFDTAVDSILVVNEQQVIVQANPASAAMFRCPMADVIGSRLERFIPQRDRQRHAVNLREFGEGAAASRQMGRSREVAALGADGVEFPIEASISHLTLGGHRLYTVILRDVSELRSAVRGLEAGKAKLQSALSSMSDAVLISDEEGHYVELNDAAATFHRFAGVDDCKRTLGDAPQTLEMSLDDGPPSLPEQRPTARALRGETASGVEYRLRRRDTGETWFGSYSYAPIRAPDGAIVGSVVVCRDVTSAKEVQADLQASHAALRRLISERDRVQEEERARIARELHDDLQQNLAAIRISLGELGDRIARGAPDARALLAELDELAAQAIGSTRRIVNDLRPRLLEELGLIPALQLMARQFALRTGIACSVVAPEAVSAALAPGAALVTCLFRVAQEALNNAEKHSGATAVEIGLALVATGQISLSVTDDGRGIGVDDRRKFGSHGILGMSERLRAQGGTLRIESLPEGGTLLEVLAPLGGAAATYGRATDDGVRLAVQDPQAGNVAPTGVPLPPALDDAPLPRLGGGASGRIVQIVIDAMPGNAAVLDGSGVIRFVNRAWNDFAAQNGNPGARSAGPGVDYVAICSRGALVDETILPVLQGLKDVVEGRRTSFSHDYPCHAPTRRTWFRMHVVAMSGAGVLVTHTQLAPAAADPAAS
jgi:PAS domain S-box-containing protein